MKVGDTIVMVDNSSYIIKDHWDQQDGQAGGTLLVSKDGRHEIVIGEDDSVIYSDIDPTTGAPVEGQGAVCGNFAGDYYECRATVAAPDGGVLRKPGDFAMEARYFARWFNEHVANEL